MTNNYDKIAKYYDFLSRAVFFKAQLKAQTDQLPFIPPNSTVLIAGGGTGWILNKLAELHPQGLHITYVEISAEMISLAKKRNVQQNHIQFINSAIEDYTTKKQYDVILTAFLFDNFSKDKLELVFDQLNALLKPDGLWLFSDFSYHPKYGKLWQRFLLKTMYLLFRFVSNIEASELIEMSVYFKKNRYKKIFKKKYYQNFIKSVVYQK